MLPKVVIYIVTNIWQKRFLKITIAVFLNYEFAILSLVVNIFIETLFLNSKKTDVDD